MKKGKKIAGLSALALATFPVVANATVLFQENFNSGTAGTRFDQFSQDNGVGAPSPNDFNANFNFNYGAWNYWHVAADFSSQDVSTPIPKAPNSGGAEPTIGLRLDANNVGGGTALLELYPKLAEYAGGVVPSGSHQFTFDLWDNYTGRENGGTYASTEFFSAGVLQQGGGLGVRVPVNPNPQFAGALLAFDADNGNGFDYRFYSSNNQLAELDARSGYAAQNVPGAGNPGPSDGTNPYYIANFPRLNPSNASDLWHETEGAIGKHWHTLKMVVDDQIIYTYIKNDGGTDFFLLSARTDETLTSGHVMVGYSDRNSSSCALESNDNTDQNFAIVDNMLVETYSAVRQKWTSNASGNWSDTTKWQSADDANGTAEVADFTTALSAARTVTVDAAKTVRSITFDSTTAGYTLAGANTITLDSITTGIRGKIKATTGSHVISAPVVLNKPLTFDIAAGASVKLTDMSFNIVMPDSEYTPDPAVLNKNGAGLAEVNRIYNLNTTATVVVNAGTLKLSANGTATGVSRITNLTIGAGAKFDISNNKLITKAVVGTFNGTVYTGVSGLVASGRSGNTWTGSGIITSQSAAAGTNYTSIGVAKATDVRPNSVSETAVWAGQTITGTDTLVMYTYGGDANLDGKLNVDDYIKIDSGISSGLTGWSNGDFNYDGKVNIDDYTTIIDANIGNQNGIFFTGGGVDGGSGVTAVPEPLAGSLLMIPALAMLRRRRKN